jgi:RecB family exonuclease
VDHVKVAPRDMHPDSWERLTRGIMIHAGMEAGFIGQSIEQLIQDACAEQEQKGLSAEQKVRLSGLYNDSVQVARDALAWLPVGDWEPVRGADGAPMAEARLELPLDGWKSWIGFADLVAVHKPSGGVYVVDYKTRGQFEQEDADRFNTQFLLYSKALAEMGIHVDGSILFEIKPTPPRRARSVSGHDDGRITSVRTSADGRFRLTPTFRPKTLVDNYWDDFRRQAAEMARTTAQPVEQWSYRNMSSFGCKTCDFQTLCLGELHGHDVEHIANTTYVTPRSSLRVVEEL